MNGAWGRTNAGGIIESGRWTGDRWGNFKMCRSGQRAERGSLSGRQSNRRQPIRKGAMPGLSQRHELGTCLPSSNSLKLIAAPLNLCRCKPNYLHN